MASINFCSMLAEAGEASSQSARSMCVEKCSDTKRTFRVVGRSESQTSTVSIRLCCDSASFNLVPASSSPISPPKMQRAPSAAMLRATLPAPPILVSLRWTAITGAGDVAIDEFGEHEIADAKYRLAANRMRQGIKIEHRNSSSVASGAPSAKTIGGIEEAPDVSLDRVFQRREAAVVPGPLQPIASGISTYWIFGTVPSAV